MKKTVKRTDITVKETVETEQPMTAILPVPLYTYWTAELLGRLSTGERVNLERTEFTFAEALASLETAIAELGWEIR